MNNERALGYAETFFCISHDVGCDSNNAAMLIELEGEINLDKFKQALYELYLRHPLLRASYYKDPEEAQYFFQLNIEFEQIDITISTLTHFDAQVGIEALEAAVHELYQPGGELWRVHLLHSTDKRPVHYLIFGFHHAIIDGISEICVIKDFIKYYQATKPLKTSETTALNIPLPINQLLNKTISRERYRQNYQAIFNRYGNVKELKFEKIVSPFESRTKIMFCDFSSDTHDKIIAFSKSRGIKVTAILNAALLLAIYQVTGHTETLLQVAVNLRQHTHPKIPDDIVGCYIQGMRVIIKNLDTYLSIEQLARDYQVQYADNFKLLSIPPQDFSISDIEALLQYLMYKPRERFLLGPAISNWGSVSFNDPGDSLKINAIHRATGRQAGESPFYLHIATINHKMQGAFNYPEPFVSRQTMADIIQTFKILLGQLAS